MSKVNFYRCAHCGNTVVFLHDSGVPLTCCGEAMQPMTANSTDAAVEKHVPTVTVENGVVEVAVGSVLHPATAEHHIEWLYLHTEQGGQMVQLDPTAPPKARFALAEGDKALAVYAYCNLHGLWVNEL